jgi:polar amino acid transport system substrate-binding protein
LAPGEGASPSAERAEGPPHPNPLPASGEREHTERVVRSYSQPIGCIVVFLAYLLCTSIAFAQTPFVIDEWKFGRRQEASTLHYCVDARDPDLPVARKIGAAIASALLLQGKEHVIGEGVVGESIDNLYRVFLESCDVYLGFKLIPDAIPDWMKVTRPYYRASYVLAATNAGWRSLADVPKSQAIGSTIGTSADLRLIQYLQALPQAERWTRFPMGTDEAALKALTSGTVGIALVWGPALWASQRSDPALAGVRVIAPSPLSASTMDVGAAVLANESFLRSNVDQAIASLVADGTIQRILDDDKFPATAPK